MRVFFFFNEKKQQCARARVFVQWWSFLTMLPERLRGVKLRGLCGRRQLVLLPKVSRQSVCHVPYSHTHTAHQNRAFTMLIHTFGSPSHTHWTQHCHIEKWWVKVAGAGRAQGNWKWWRPHCFQLNSQVNMLCNIVIFLSYSLDIVKLLAFLKKEVS